MPNINNLSADAIILKKHFRKLYQGLMRAVFNRPRLAYSERWLDAFETAWLSCDGDGFDYFAVSDFMVNLLRSRGVDPEDVNPDMPGHNRIMGGSFEDEARFLSVLHTEGIRRHMRESCLVDFFRSFSSCFHVYHLFTSTLLEVRESTLPDNASIERIERFDATCLSNYYRAVGIYRILLLFEDLERLTANGFVDLLRDGHRDMILRIADVGRKRFYDNRFYALLKKRPLEAVAPFMIFFAQAYDEAVFQWEKVCADNPMGGFDAAMSEMLGYSEGTWPPKVRRWNFIKDLLNSDAESSETADPAERHLKIMGSLEVACVEMAVMVGEFLAELESEIRS